MAWWDNIGSLLTQTIAANPALGTEMLNTISGQSKQNAQINNLLMQVVANPASAANVAAIIISMPNIPPQVVGLVNALPTVANDHVQLTLLIAQIQAQLPHSSLFG